MPLPLRLPLFRRLPLLRRLLFLRGLLRHLLAFRPRLGKADRDRLLAALDLAAGAAALQRTGLALLHRAPDLGGCLFRIFSCHDISPGCGKIILTIWESSVADALIGRPQSIADSRFSCDNFG